MNLFGLERHELEREMTGRGLPAFRGRQIYRALYARGVGSFDEMSDLSRALREDLSRHYEIARPSVETRYESVDGTVKHLVALADGRNVECVYIPETHPRPRHTFCLSTQVGCPLKCSFCFSGTVRFERNLSAGEILGQFLAARAALSEPPPRSNIVFMGMGEPLLNSEAVQKAIRILADDEAFSVSPRRITVSTSGITDELLRFAESAPAVGLAISLHAPTDELRSRIMPINRKHPLEELLAAARRLPLPKRRRITFEYVLLGEENDSPEDAQKLAALLQGVKAKVNLISYNPWPGAPHRRSTRERTDRFLQILADRGLTASLRRSRGDDVLAACGQLANRAPEAESVESRAPL
jgi:23S rRNA (adenine2503-C2)-methyltransferase